MNLSNSTRNGGTSVIPFDVDNISFYDLLVLQGASNPRHLRALETELADEHGAHPHLVRESVEHLRDIGFVKRKQLTPVELTTWGEQALAQREGELKSGYGARRATPITVCNASSVAPYVPPRQAYRPGAFDHQAYKSRGVRA